MKSYESLSSDESLRMAAAENPAKVLRLVSTNCFVSFIVREGMAHPAPEAVYIYAVARLGWHMPSGQVSRPERDAMGFDASKRPGRIDIRALEINCVDSELPILMLRRSAG